MVRGNAGGPTFGGRDWQGQEVINGDNQNAGGPTFGGQDYHQAPTQDVHRPRTTSNPPVTGYRGYAPRPQPQPQPRRAVQQQGPVCQPPLATPRIRSYVPDREWHRQNEQNARLVGLAVSVVIGAVIAIAVACHRHWQARFVMSGLSAGVAGWLFASGLPIWGAVALVAALGFFLWGRHR